MTIIESRGNENGGLGSKKVGNLWDIFVECVCEMKTEHSQSVSIPFLQFLNTEKRGRGDEVNE